MVGWLCGGVIETYCNMFQWAYELPTAIVSMPSACVTAFALTLQQDACTMRMELILAST